LDLHEDFIIDVSFERKSLLSFKVIRIRLGWGLHYPSTLAYW